MIVMADHEESLMPSRRVLLTECSGWCIMNESGNAIALNPVSVASTLEAILAGAASQKHSRNVLERCLQVRLSLHGGCVLMLRNAGLVHI